MSSKYRGLWVVLNYIMFNIVEAHCYALQCIGELIVSKYRMSLYNIIHCSEQSKARTAYKLKNYRVRLGRYSNQICFQCASQAITCQQMGQSLSPSQDCSRVCPHGHKEKTKERQTRKSDIPRSQGTQPEATLIGQVCPHTPICIFIG